MCLYKIKSWMDRTPVSAEYWRVHDWSKAGRPSCCLNGRTMPELSVEVTTFQYMRDQIASDTDTPQMYECESFEYQLQINCIIVRLVYLCNNKIKNSLQESIAQRCRRYLILIYNKLAHGRREWRDTRAERKWQRRTVPWLTHHTPTADW